MDRMQGVVPALVTVLMLAMSAPAAVTPQQIQALRAPDGGIQPQAVIGDGGRIHLIYYKGEHRGGDVYYVHSDDAGKTFSDPLRVNSRPVTAVAMGGVRGAHIALGRNGRVHIAWMGARGGEGGQHGHGHGDVEMWYTRLDGNGRSFEPQRNLLTVSGALDGGGSVAADEQGNVYVAWHGLPKNQSVRDEASRQVWLAVSKDGGASFNREMPVTPAGEGVCACCGMRAFATADGTLLMLHRSATDLVNRDMMLTWGRAGQPLRHLKVDPWQVNRCPMSTAVIRPAPGGAAIAWETDGRVFAGLLDTQTGKLSAPIEPPGTSRERKHPSVAVSADGTIALAWTEGMAWNRGGKVAWQVFDAAGKAIEGAAGSVPGVPAFSLVSIVPKPQGGFVLIY